MRRIFALGILLIAGVLSAVPAAAQSGGAQKPQPFDREQMRKKMNENFLVMLGGPFGATYLQLAHDIAAVVGEAEGLRVLPVAAPGAQTNIGDILFVRGVDLGITTVQVLNAAKASGEFGPNLERQIAYIAPLSVDTFQVLARAELSSVQDLKGKRVSFSLKGSGSSRFGPAVLKALGVGTLESNVAPADATQMMRNGELDALVCSCPIPVPALPTIKGDSGFKFLEVPYIPAFEQDYVPASLTSENYPNLIAKDTKVQTIATSTVLITFNWPVGSERYRRIEKFVNAFFSNMDKLRQAPRHPAWREVNIAASVRGWQRFSAAQQWLDRQAAQAKPRGPVDPAEARALATKAAPRNPAEQERLFKEFLEWSRTKAGR